MGDIVLSIKVKDLRVAINADRKVSEMFRIAGLNSNNIIWLFNKNIACKKYLITSLCKSIVIRLIPSTLYKIEGTMIRRTQIR